jgi:hypothetical protein
MTRRASAQNALKLSGHDLSTLAISAEARHTLGDVPAWLPAVPEPITFAPDEV